MGQVKTFLCSPHPSVYLISLKAGHIEQKKHALQFLIIDKTGRNPVRVVNSIFFQSFQRYRLLMLNTLLLHLHICYIAHYIVVKGLIHTSVVFRLGHHDGSF
jgi:hypothetical protein